MILEKFIKTSNLTPDGHVKPDVTDYIPVHFSCHRPIVYCLNLMSNSLRLKSEAGVTKSLNANNFIMTGDITKNLMTSSAGAIASTGHMVER